MLTILTPTYNRGYIIKKAYDSLVEQTNINFEWLVIDDGSTDNTESIFKKFINEKKINIRYFKKENGGKHTAINYGVKKAKGNYIIILDSDDFLTSDAVEVIYKYIDMYDNDKKIACLSFLRIHENGKVIGKTYDGNVVVSNNIDFKYNKGFIGDMAEVFKTSVLKKYPFPIFNDEKFLSEAIVWNKIAFNYDTAFINKGIYVCEYLNDGLSKNILVNRIKCPVGAYENARIFMDKRFKFIIRLKNSIIYTGFYLISRKSNHGILTEVPSRFLIILMYPFGLLFYLYLKFIKKNIENGDDSNEKKVNNK